MKVQRSCEPLLFFSKREKARIVDAIRAAERCTSGEIRVHLESRCAGEPIAHAAALMENLGMRRTAARNGVLILLAVATHQVVICADDAINAVVPPTYWDERVAEMTAAFRDDRFADGLAAAIDAIGQQLQQHFPYDHRDVNELPDEISYSR